MGQVEAFHMTDFVSTLLYLKNIRDNALEFTTFIHRGSVLEHLKEENQGAANQATFTMTRPLNQCMCLSKITRTHRNIFTNRTRTSKYQRREPTSFNKLDDSSASTAH